MNGWAGNHKAGAWSLGCFLFIMHTAILFLTAMELYVTNSHPPEYTINQQYYLSYYCTVVTLTSILSLLFYQPSCFIALGVGVWKAMRNLSRWHALKPTFLP
jgi:hypothetical protein